jgi:hypothetical protein
MSLEKAIADTAALVEQISEEIMRTVVVGQNLR